jgi:formate--tetrahydrofolate ligase
MHAGVARVVAGKPLAESLKTENVEAVEKGAENLVKHIENARLFGVPVVVAINRFTTDTDSEIAAVRRIALDAGAEAAVESTVWANGGAGGAELAEAVVAAAEKPSQFRFLYPLEASIKEKIEAIATQIYGADGVDYLPEAEAKIRLYNRLGYANLPICMAKTHLSLSHDQNLKGRPRGYRVPIRDLRASIGAGFIYPLLGEMRTMPGLPSEPAGQRVDIDENGRVVGLF